MSKRPILILTAAVITACALVLAASDEPAHTRPAKDKPGPNRRGFRGKHSPRLTKQQEDKLLSALAERRPEYHRHLLELRESNPRRYRWALAGMWRWYQRFQRMPKAEREAYLKAQDARIRALRLVRAIREEKDQQKAAELKDRLRQAVAEQFQAEQERFEARLARLAEHVKRLRQELKDRRKRRRQIIAERVQRMLEGKPGRLGGRGRRHPWAGRTP